MMLQFPKMRRISEIQGLPMVSHVPMMPRLRDADHASFVIELLVVLSLGHPEIDQRNFAERRIWKEHSNQKQKQKKYLICTAGPSGYL
jgi:hypothetical protein